jgi:hypothetical protein
MPHAEVNNVVSTDVTGLGACTSFGGEAWRMAGIVHSFRTYPMNFCMQADMEEPEEQEERVIIIPCGPRPHNCRAVIVPAETALMRKVSKAKKTAKKVAQASCICAPPKRNVHAPSLAAGRADNDMCKSSMHIRQASVYPLHMTLSQFLGLCIVHYDKLFCLAQIIH